MKKSTTSLENFCQHVDTFMSQKTRKSINGRYKSNFEMKVWFLIPKGKKFTYRSDDTLRKLEEVSKITAQNELHALQIQYAFIRNKVKAAIIYDNSVEFGENNTLFHVDNGKVVVNKLEW